MAATVKQFSKWPFRILHTIVNQTSVEWTTLIVSAQFCYMYYFRADRYFPSKTLGRREKLILRAKYCIIWTVIVSKELVNTETVLHYSNECSENF